MNDKTQSPSLKPRHPDKTPEPRVRLNAKQNTKGKYQLDVTVETYGIENSAYTTPRVVRLLTSFENEMKAAGFEIAGGDK